MPTEEPTLDFPSNENTTPLTDKNPAAATVSIPAEGSRPEVASDSTALPQIPGYTVEAEIARGGMGVVYRAHNQRLNRPAAIKMILGGRYHDPMARVRFLIEAEAAAALDHPHIVQVHEFGSHENLPFFALEFVGGGTLREQLDRDGPPGPREAAELLVKLADAVAAAHAKGIVHRDLKPANILLTESGEPKITDFGLAKVGQSDVTASGAIMGSPSYMSPEQAAGRTKEVGTSADVYSLGAVLYELLTGRPPFKGGSSIETIQKVLTGEVDRPCVVNSRIPRDLETICLKCLEKEVRKRYATVSDLADDLRNYLAGRPIQARPVGNLERTVKWLRRNPGRAAVMSAAVLILVGVGVAVDEVRKQREADRIAVERETRTNSIIDSLGGVETSVVPRVLDDLADLRPLARPRLGELASQPISTKSGLHARLALLADEPERAIELAAYLPICKPEEFLTLRESLLSHSAEVSPGLWDILRDPKAEAGKRVRAACALAGLAPADGRWRSVAKDVTALIARENPLQAVVWAQALEPVRLFLLPELLQRYSEARGKIEAGNLPVTDLAAEAAALDLTANLLARYATDRPAELAELAMTVDGRHLPLYFAAIQTHRQAVAPLLEAEFDKVLTFAWDDSPIDPAWAPVAPGIREQLDRADGLLTERFAFCQTLPLAEFERLATTLGHSGYRPTRLRPYEHNGSVRVAAIWTRDGRPWRLASDRTLAQLEADDEQNRTQGFTVVDAAGYVANSGGTRESRYSGLWEKAASPIHQSRFYLGVNQITHKASHDTLEQAGFNCQQTLQMFGDPAGVIRFTGVKFRTNPVVGWWAFWNAPLTPFRSQTRSGDVPVDVGIGTIVRAETPGVRNEANLHRAEANLQKKPDDLQALFVRSVARFHLGQNAEALKDLATVLEKDPQRADAFAIRAVLHARLGDYSAAEADRLAHEKISDSQSTQIYLRAILQAHAGQTDAAIKDLEAFRGANSTDASALYDVACTYSILSEMVRAKDRERAETLAGQAVAALKHALDRGYKDFAHIRNDPDFDPVRERTDFVQLMIRSETGFRYCGVWNSLPDREAHRMLELNPVDHLRRAEELLAQGYRPVALSACTADGGTVAASVWHRPVIRDEAKELLAKRQASAGVVLLRLGLPDRVWPLLRHSPDPRVRSYLIHRLFPLGADPAAIAKRLEEEPDPSSRRALLLALGEFDEASLPVANRQALLPKVQQMFRADPDAGVHAAADWLLRQWKQSDWIREQEAAWAKDEKQREEARRAGLAPGALPTWYVNGQGQTYTVIPGPVQFRMGSPPWERDRYERETPHIRRIGRTIAIAAKSVTLAEYRRLTRERHVIEAKLSYSDDLPVIGLNWYMAASYCNRLSEAEGIPQEQWCYEIKGPQDIRLKKNCLSLTGYRLPTEAEMEFATRAGTTTSRYYGETEELLGHYAWYMKNSIEKLRPIGLRKPNDFGLFDSLGNCNTWCQTAFEAYPNSGQVHDDVETDIEIVSTRHRVPRGVAFDDLPSIVRSAYRGSNWPSYTSKYFGVRPTRTLIP